MTAFFSAFVQTHLFCVQIYVTLKFSAQWKHIRATLTEATVQHSNRPDSHKALLSDRYRTPVITWLPRLPPRPPTSSCPFHYSRYSQNTHLHSRPEGVVEEKTLKPVIWHRQREYRRCQGRDLVKCGQGVRTRTQMRGGERWREETRRRERNWGEKRRGKQRRGKQRRGSEFLPDLPWAGWAVSPRCWLHSPG